MKKEDVILIVDQNVSRKNNLSSRLRNMGYATELSSSGFHILQLLEEAIENQKKLYRLVLIVEQAEDMPGREIMLLIRNLVQDKRKLPVLIINSDNDPDFILDTIKEGANDYIVEQNNEAKIIGKISKLAPIPSK